jgi:hypothetical protein
MYAERKMTDARARGDTRAEQYWRHVAQVIDSCPPLTARRKADLYLILGSADKRPVVREAGDAQPLPRRRRAP